MGNLVIFFAALFAAIQRNFPEHLPGISAGVVGLSISYALKVKCLFTVQCNMWTLLMQEIALESTHIYIGHFYDPHCTHLYCIVNHNVQITYNDMYNISKFVCANSFTDYTGVELDGANVK